jgi:hypothetical protein
MLKEESFMKGKEKKLIFFYGNLTLYL